MLNGRGGNDTLTGGANADKFVYSAGADTITDFDRSSGSFNHGEGDRIDLTGSGVNTWVQLQTIMSQVGSDTFINFGSGNSLTLTNVTKTNLTAADFGLAPVTVTVVAPNGYDMHGLYGDMANANVDAGTANGTHFDAVNSGSGHTYHVVGSGFTYSVNGVTGGTVTEIDILNTADSSTQVTETGFAINAVTLQNALQAYNANSDGSQLNAIFNQYNFNATGGAGNDTLPGFGYTDTFNGGGGSDTVDYVHATSGITVNLADPTQNTGNAAFDSYVNVTNVIGTNFADTLIGDGNNNVLEGGTGADVLIGGGGTRDFASYHHASTGVTASLANSAINTGDAQGDTYSGISGLIGSNFADTLIGDNGDNFLRGRGGGDTLNGGLGSDTADYANGQAVTVDLSNTANNTGDALGDTYISIENIRGSSFNDVLKGDGGNNVLTGGAGADTFVFAPGFGHDTVTDYTPNSDILQFDHSDFANVAALLAATHDDANTHLAVIATQDGSHTVALNVNTATLQQHQSDIHIV